MNGIFTLLVLFSVPILLASSQRRCQNTQFECDNGHCIPKSNWCKSNYYPRCSDNSDTRNCGRYRSCYSGQKTCTNDGKCIPAKWFCDGYQDCSDASDEKSCGVRSKIPNIHGVSSARSNALNWIVKERRPNWGWEDDTSRAMVSLYFANNRRFVPGDTNSQLMVKQLQIQLSKMLLKNGTTSIPAHQMALYVHALLATCLNPRNFQGFDLVEILKQQLHTSDSFNPFLALALCNANETLSSKTLLQLAEVMNRPNKPEWTDSQAYAAMALICARRVIGNISNSYNRENDTIAMHDLPYHIKIVIPVNHTVDINVNNVTSAFKNLQHENGSFGSVYTTGLVLQALIATDGPEDGWNLDKAIKYLISEQKRDGSFGSFLSTYLVLPLLHSRTLLDLGTVNCAAVGSKINNLTVQEELDSIRSLKQRVKYSVWVGTHKDVSFSISVKVPVNRTFFDVMRLAKELDPRYRFEYYQYFWGKYIYSIFGVVNDPEARMYWHLYHVEGENVTFVDKAPDHMIPEQNGWYAYWYRPTNHNLN